MADEPEQIEIIVSDRLIAFNVRVWEDGRVKRRSVPPGTRITVVKDERIDAALVRGAVRKAPAAAHKSGGHSGDAGSE